MNMSKALARLVFASLAATCISASHAALQARDLNGDTNADAYYDTVLDITWLKDANFASTSGFDADGKMTWANATSWAAGLDVFGVGGWRLPSTTDLGTPGCDFSLPPGGTDCGYKVSPASSEMAHMFYVTLGNKGFDDAGYGLANAGPFVNLSPTGIYWSETTAATTGGTAAWMFWQQFGYQEPNLKSNENYAWAVHSGDVAAVPEAPSYVLLLAGLAVVCARRAPHRNRGSA